MGSNGGAPSPLPSHTSMICCMCGDHGLPQELFRCKVCAFRSQHKYCSNLYPKAEAYRACNWCLTEDGGKPVARGSTMDHNNDNNNSSSSGGGSGVKLQRGAFASHLNKPIKKQRLPERSPDVEHSPSSGKLGRHDFRAKVRRYKLLEDVSS